MIEIVDARGGDVGALRETTGRASGRYVASVGRRPAPMLADHGALVRAGRVRVAFVDDEVAGGTVMWREVDHWYVDSVAVHPSRRRSGVGTALLGDADRALARRGAIESACTPIWR